MSDIADELKRVQEANRLRFGVENTIWQAIWDAQVDDYAQNELFTFIIEYTRRILDDEELQRQVKEIDLTQYEEDEDESI